MNKVLTEIIQEALDQVNQLNSPGASFGAGVAIGVLIKHIDEYEKSCFDKGFDDAMECAENLIMGECYDFKCKKFPKEDQELDIDTLIQKYGIREVNDRYLEYIGVKK